MRSLARDFSSSRRAPPKAHDMGMGVRSMHEGADALVNAFLVTVQQQVEAETFRF
jgi:hypothetical protein